MNIEELKLILSTVQAAGQGAYTLAIVWFVVGFFKFLFGIGLVLVAIVFTERTVKYLIYTVSFGGKVLEALGSIEASAWLSKRSEVEYLDKIRKLSKE